MSFIYTFKGIFIMRRFPIVFKDIMLIQIKYSSSTPNSMLMSRGKEIVKDRGWEKKSVANNRISDIGKLVLCKVTDFIMKMVQLLTCE